MTDRVFNQDSVILSPNLAPASSSSNNSNSTSISSSNRRRSSFGFNFLTNITNSIRPSNGPSVQNQTLPYSSSNNNIHQSMQSQSQSQALSSQHQPQSPQPHSQAHQQAPQSITLRAPNNNATNPPSPLSNPTIVMNLNSSLSSNANSNPNISYNSNNPFNSLNANRSVSSTQTGISLQPPNTFQNQNHFMSNSPTIGNLHQFSHPIERTSSNNLNYNSNTDNNDNDNDIEDNEDEDNLLDEDNDSHMLEANHTIAISHSNEIVMAPAITASTANTNNLVTSSTNVGSSHQVINSAFTSNSTSTNELGCDKDGFFSIRLTPLIDHSSSSTGLYFTPIIRKLQPIKTIAVGRYTDKNRQAAHAPQGSSASVVFKSKVVSRTHAQFTVNQGGQWFIRDLKSSSGTFLNHIRLSPAAIESKDVPLADGDIIQLGMDYRGGTEEVYRCVKMRIEMNKSWQRKVNQYNLETHNKLKQLANLNNPINLAENQQNVNQNAGTGDAVSAQSDLSECCICLLKLEPCQALFISPCSHFWHYKCIRPIILKSYPQFYCPNCRSMCDLETDIDD